MITKDDSESIESLLLDLHLKRLSRPEVETVEDAVAHSPELAGQSRALRDVLALLDRYEAVEPPDDLADRVLARVNDRAGVVPFPQAAVEPRAESGRELSGSPMLSLRELIAIAACITLFIGVFLPGYYKARNAAARNLCRTNLALQYAGMAKYAEANLGLLPSAGFREGGYWQPVRVPKVLRAPNTRHFYLILRNGQVNDSRAFLCPSDGEARQMVAEDYKEFDDFAERANNSYSFIFMNRREALRLDELQKSNSRMALVGDRNPLTDGRAVHRLNPYDEESFNSPTHENGAGQNVLYGDGHAAWSTNPLVGPDRDNIYRSGQLVRYLGNETPTSPTDSFLP